MQVSAARLPLALSLPPSVLLCVPGAASAFCRQTQRRLRCEPAALLGSDLGMPPQNPWNVVTAFGKKKKLHVEPSFHPNLGLRLVSEQLWRSGGTEGLGGVGPSLLPSLPRFPGGRTGPGSSRSQAGANPCGMVGGCEPRGWIWGTEHRGLREHRQQQLLQLSGTSTIPPGRLAPRCSLCCPSSAGNPLRHPTEASPDTLLGLKDPGLNLFTVFRPGTCAFPFTSPLREVCSS